MKPLDFQQKKQELVQAFYEHYASYPKDVSDILEKLDEADEKESFLSVFGVKGMQYRILAENAKVKVFRHCPFYFEMIK